MRIARQCWLFGLTATVATAMSAQVVAAEARHWRLFVADHGEPVVRAVDLGTGETSVSFQLTAPARLYRSESGETVFAAQRDGDVVHAIASGVRLDDHGDHGDLEVEAPQLLDVTLAGDNPVHVVEHDGRLAVFFDDEGVARITDERAFRAGKLRLTEFTTSAPHHGVAATIGDHLLVSVPNPQDPTELPIGIRVHDEAGATVGEMHSCPDLHGEAASGSLMAIACAEGLLLVEPSSAGPTVRTLPYPPELPDGKSTTLIGGEAMRYFVGNWGQDAVVIIEPNATPAFRLVQLPARRVHFAADPVRPRFVYLHTEDGNLHQLDVLEGRIVRSTAVTDAYSMEGHWSDPRPRIAVAGDEIAVTDPLAGLIHIVEPSELRRTRAIKVEGRPFEVVSVGGAGETH